MLTVYVAGPITNPDPTKFIENCKNGMRRCAQVMKLGYAPCNIFSDFLYIIAADNLNVQHLIDTGMSWLRKADIVVFTGNWQKSPGCLKEHAEALRLDKQIFYSISCMHSAIGSQSSD